MKASNWQSRSKLIEYVLHARELHRIHECKMKTEYRELKVINEIGSSYEFSSKHHVFAIKLNYVVYRGENEFSAR